MRLAVYLLMIAATFYFAGMFRYEPLLLVGLVEVLLMAAMLPLPFFVRRKLTVRLLQVQQRGGISAASLHKKVSADSDRGGTSAASLQKKISADSDREGNSAASPDSGTQQQNANMGTYYVNRGKERRFLVIVTNRGKLPGGSVRIRIDISYVNQIGFRNRSKRTTKFKPISKYRLTPKSISTSKYKPTPKSISTSKYKPAPKSISASKGKLRREKMIGASNPGDNPLEAHVSFPYCGLVTVYMKFNYVYDYFSLFRARLPYREQISYAVIPCLPGMQFLMSSSMQWESGDGMDTYPERVDWGYDILQVRDVRPGEGERQIHWKLSARSDKVIVKEYEREDSQKAYLFLENSEIHRGGLAGKSAFYEVIYALILGLTERELAVRMFYFDGMKYEYEHTEIRNLTELQEAMLLLYQLDAQPIQLSLGLPTPPWSDANNRDFDSAYRFRVNENLQLFYGNELLWEFQEDTVERDVMEQIFTL
jgi:hypothetical protein